MVKLEFTGYTLFLLLLFLLKNIDGGSNEYPQAVLTIFI